MALVVTIQPSPTWNIVTSHFCVCFPFCPCNSPFTYILWKGEFLYLNGWKGSRRSWFLSIEFDIVWLMTMSLYQTKLNVVNTWEQWENRRNVKAASTEEKAGKWMKEWNEWLMKNRRRKKDEWLKKKWKESKTIKKFRFWILLFNLWHSLILIYISEWFSSKTFGHQTLRISLRFKDILTGENKSILIPFFLLSPIYFSTKKKHVE